MALERTPIFVNLPVRDLASRIGKSVARYELVDDEELFILFGGDSEDDAAFGLCGGVEGSDTVSWTEILAPSRDHSVVSKILRKFKVEPSQIHSATDGDDKPLFDVPALQAELARSRKAEAAKPTRTSKASGRPRPTPKPSASHYVAKWLVIHASMLSKHVVDREITAFLGINDHLKKHVVIVNASALAKPTAKSAIGMRLKVSAQHPLARRPFRPDIARVAKARAKALLKHNAVPQAGVVTHVVSGLGLARITAKIGEADKVLVMGVNNSVVTTIKAHTDAEVVISDVHNSRFVARGSVHETR